MKISEAGLVFPAIGFTPNLAAWGFRDWDTFTSSGRVSLKEGAQIGMEVVDADLRRWVVRSVKPVGRAEPLWKWLLGWILSTPLTRVEHDLEELPPISLEDLKARLIRAIEANWDCYCNDDEIDTVLRPLIAEVEGLSRISDALDLLGLDSFKAY